MCLVSGIYIFLFLRKTITIIIAACQAYYNYRLLPLIYSNIVGLSQFSTIIKPKCFHKTRATHVNNFLI